MGHLLNCDMDDTFVVIGLIGKVMAPGVRKNAVVTGRQAAIALDTDYRYTMSLPKSTTEMIPAAPGTPQYTFNLH